MIDLELGQVGGFFDAQHNHCVNRKRLDVLLISSSGVDDIGKMVGLWPRPAGPHSLSILLYTVVAIHR